ncbi:MAG: Holliday junction resolvase RecU [Acidobacteriota bacterium]|nr:Holliday junction resolvase RecU [Blastocatellia bacterium]MDW8412951.1 Holliday junction resolvase RecU [Acidobacteriota bacterium]
MISRRGADVGSGFQAAVNATNEAYARLGRAYITRKAVPGKYLRRQTQLLVDLPEQDEGRLSSEELRRLLASQQGQSRVFVPESKAEPDYGGAVAPEGRAIFYDAKSTRRERLDLDNLHPHQIHFLEQMAKNGAIAGFLVEFTRYQQVFFLPIQLAVRYISLTGYRSIPYNFFKSKLVAVQHGTGYLIFDYLAAIKEQELAYGRDYAALDLSAERIKQAKS